MTEAFLWMRSHLGALPEEARQQHTEALVTQLAQWAVSSPHPSGRSQPRQSLPQQGAGAQGASSSSGGSGGGGGGGMSWAKQLLELPLSGGEEEVLVSWLVAQAEAGRPAGDLLPLYFAQVSALAAVHTVIVMHVGTSLSPFGAALFPTQLACLA